MPIISVTVIINRLEYLEKVIEKMNDIKKIHPNIENINIEVRT